MPEVSRDGLYELECTVCKATKMVPVVNNGNVPLSSLGCGFCGTNTMTIRGRLESGSRPSWDQYFTQLLPVIKSRASCPRRQGGALIVDQHNNLISTGYNGTPSGMLNCIEHPCGGQDDPSGDTTNCLALHAEHNAIYYAGDRKSEAHTMYCTTLPCIKCALEILQTPIRRVVYLEDYPDKRCRGVFHQGGVSLEQFEQSI